MWSRREIKAYAKEFLKLNYWKAFIVCLIVGFLEGGKNRGTTVQYRLAAESFRSSSYYNWSLLRSIFTSGFLILFLIFVIIKIIIGFNIEVGKARFFLRGLDGGANIADTFTVLYKDEYFDILKTQILKKIYIFLWSLLFIIPGIIKYYQYIMVPYILAENPHINSSKAFSLSKAMTRGHKFDIFILNLSFIGWDILGLLLFGIGGIFVNPYKAATEARLYSILKNMDYSGAYY